MGSSHPGPLNSDSAKNAGVEQDRFIWIVQHVQIARSRNYLEWDFLLLGVEGFLKNKARRAYEVRGTRVDYGVWLLELRLGLKDIFLL